MGWTIGLPSLKLNNTGSKSKHCGDFGAVAAEALEERKGHDPDIDPTRADQNITEGFRTAAELQEYSRKHVEQLRDSKGRKLRKDAVVMCATIIKPPEAMMATLSREDQLRFLSDASDCLRSIIGQNNEKSRAFHFDECGGHLHTFWEPMTPDGRLCAKEMHNLQFLARLNREMPVYLRSKGWDIDDCQAYDAAEQELMSDMEKAEKRRKNGRSSAVYKAQAEKRAAELQQQVTALEETVEKISQEKEDLQKKNEALRQHSEMLIKENERMAAESEKQVAQFQENKRILAEQQRDIDAAAEWLEQIPDWPTYEEEANRAFRLVDEFRELLQKTYGSAWPFRNRRAEQGILKAVEGVRDTIMSTVSAMRGFEVRESVPDHRQRSRAVTRSLEDLTANAQIYASRKQLKEANFGGMDWKIQSMIDQATGTNYAAEDKKRYFEAKKKENER